MAAEVTVTDDAVEAGEVRPLFGLAGYYDVSADGQNFLIPYRPDTKSPEPLTLIQNWTSGLKK